MVQPIRRTSIDGLDVPSTAEDIVLVDLDDRPLGTGTKLDVHRRGLTHRAISVLLSDSAGRLLLQQRAHGKYHSGGLWTNTCCSHPGPGEDVAVAARRRLFEEMGIACELAFLFRTHYRAAFANGLIEDEVVHVFGGRFDGAPVPDPAEAAGWRWIEPVALRADMARQPEAYSAWFRHYVDEHWAALT